LIVRLQRLISGSHGTFGVLRAPGWTALSIECPWINNIRNVSCIPDGQYRVVMSYSPKFRRRMYEILDVPGRSGIRLHGGNLAGDRTKGLITHFSGCIGLGIRQGVLSNQRAVLISQATVSTFESLMQHKDFDLIIEGDHA